MDDQELLKILMEILGHVQRLTVVLERYQELLPEPGSIKARVLRHKVAANAAEHWKQNGG